MEDFMQVSSAPEDYYEKKLEASRDNRVKRACFSCNKRHIKCDGSPHCHQCMMRGLVCAYPPTTHSKEFEVLERPLMIRRQPPPKILLPPPVVKMHVPTSWAPSIPLPRVLTQGRAFVAGQFRVTQARRFVAPLRMNVPVPAIIQDEVQLAQVVSGGIITNYNKVLKRQSEEPTALEELEHAKKRKLDFPVPFDRN